MFSMEFEDVIKKIQDKSGMDKETIVLKVQQKQKELSNLVTEVGAAHIIANEMGINLVEGLNNGRIQISNLVPDLRNVNIIGRVIYKNKVFTFNKNGKEGAVASFVLGDETGQVRVVVWNEMIDVLDKLQEGDVLKVFFGMVKKNKNGGLEVHLTTRSKLKLNPEEDTSFLPPLDGFRKSFYDKKNISSLADGDKVELKAMVVGLNRLAFYDVCSKCNSSMKDGVCKNGCGAPSKKNPILNVVLDDGTGTINAALFGASAQELAGKDLNEQTEQDSLNSLVGKELIFRGNVKTNQMFNRLELSVFGTRETDTKGEINNILKN